MTDVERIASGLSPDEIRVLRALPIQNAGSHPDWDTCYALFCMKLGTVYRGALVSNDPGEGGIDVSPLGLRVKAHLEGGK